MEDEVSVSLSRDEIRMLVATLRNVLEICPLEAIEYEEPIMARDIEGLISRFRSALPE